MSKITCKEIVKRIEDAIEKEGLKCHISKNGEWGYNRFVDGKENTICLGSFNPDTYNKAFSIVKEVVKDTPYSASKDNYYTIFVDAPKELRIQRVMQRDGSSRQQVEARIKMQRAEEQRQKADFIIENEGAQQDSLLEALQRILKNIN